MKARTCDNCGSPIFLAKGPGDLSIKLDPDRCYHVMTLPGGGPPLAVLGKDVFPWHRCHDYRTDRYREGLQRVIAYLTRGRHNKAKEAAEAALGPSEPPAHTWVEEV